MKNLLSIIIPVYNEEKTIAKIIEKIIAIDLDMDKEIIVVDDGSTDQTLKILNELKTKIPFKLLTHQTNQGKGAAIQTGLKAVEGDIVIIQDADLEYDPQDYPRLIAPILKGQTKVVYGSRNLGAQKISYWRYYWGGKFLTWLFNLLYRTRLTDINTGYKVFSTDLIKSLNLECPGFEFCEEVTAKLTKKGIKILEIPIRYQPRKFAEGKKIKWIDGLIGLWTIIKYWLYH